MVPCVRFTDKIRKDNGKIVTYNKPRNVIFNGYKKKYAATEMQKYGMFVEKLEVPTKEDIETETAMMNLKGGDCHDPKYIKEIFRLMYAMRDELEHNGRIEETELMHKLIPESIGKEGKELEPYFNKFTDAMYMIIKAREMSGRKIDSALKEYDMMWKNEHGYLEGR